MTSRLLAVSFDAHDPGLLAEFWARLLGREELDDLRGPLLPAVQSPQGGTKVAWGGPPVAPKRGRNRQRFDLVLTDGALTPRSTG